MSIENKHPDPFTHLKKYLFARRESILNKWRTRCSIDNNLHTRTSFSREEFNDQMPVLLNIFEQRIVGGQEESDAVERAGQHGLHRWQRGYSLAELLSELNNLNDIISAEIEGYLALYPETEPGVIAQTHGKLLTFSRDITMGSVMYYDKLRQSRAAERVQALQESVDKLREITRQRGEHLRESSHNLRGSFSIAAGAAQLLQLPGSEEDRKEFLRMLASNIEDAEHMINQLLDYARLESSQENLANEPFNAAAVLNTLVAEAQGLASSRNVILKADGPDELNVVGDAFKVQRLAQNILTNALQNTNQDWVSVSWALENDTRWIMSVQDSSGGLRSGPLALLAAQLQPVLQPASAHRAGSPAHNPGADAVPAKNDPDEAGHAKSEGKGIGLYIAKSLCELMKGSMDIENSEHGTLVRVRLLVNQRVAERGM